ncbi:MAG: ethanolamine permease [Cytophagales bacterium]|nr:ethanolamine permease [Cytophagales bacterium]
MQTIQTETKPTLRKEINAVQLWALAVGMVISGEYFGWNYGWGTSGTVGFLVSTLLVTVMYVTFILSYTELTAAIPEAGGPFAFATRAFGPIGGFIAGFATLVDFLLAMPAISYALGAYIHFLLPQVPVVPTAISMYVVFIAFNLFGIREGARLSLVVTVLSVAEIVVFMLLIVTSFRYDNFVAHNPPTVTFGAVFAGIPFAIWFFVAIEGVAMVAEEVKNPQITIPKGYISAIATLVVLALGVMVLSAGVGDWRQLQAIDHPLPQVLAMVFGQESGWTKVFTSLGLFGLVASFHGNTISYSRQIFALARENYLPFRLSRLNRYQSPHWALVAGGVIGIIAIFSGNAEKIIVMSALGAVVMYAVSMVSLLVLRRKEPNLHRPYRTPLFPAMPYVALILTLLSTAAIVYYYPWLSALFFGLLAVSLAVFVGVKRVERLKG